MFPPVPESPVRHPRPGGLRAAAGTPRGMHLRPRDDDEDDVSVLTFDTRLHHASGASFVRSARENLERMIEGSKAPPLVAADDDERSASLARIAEEAGSRCSESRASQVPPPPAEPSPALAGPEDDGDDGDDGDDSSDADTLSLAESVLDSTNRVLSSMRASPWRRNRKASPPTQGPPSSPPGATRPDDALREMDAAERAPDTDGTKVEAPSSPKDPRPEQPSTSRGPYDEQERTTAPSANAVRESRVEIASTFLNSYFSDENADPAAGSRRDAWIGALGETNQNVRRLQAETELLRARLQERRAEARRSGEALGASLRKAHALLQRDDGNGNEESDAARREDLNPQKFEADVERLRLQWEVRQLHVERTNAALGASTRRAHELLETLAEDRKA